MKTVEEVKRKQIGLYDPRFEHDKCGIGAIVNIKGVKTHETVANALKIVENLEHRAGKDAEGKTGDGVGILVQISHKFFSKEAKKLGIQLGEERDYGIGMFFFPQDELKRNQAKKMFEIMDVTVDDVMDSAGLPLLGIVPEDANVTLAAAFESPLLRYTKRGAAAACRRIAKRILGLPEPGKI